MRQLIISSVLVLVGWAGGTCAHAQNTTAGEDVERALQSLQIEKTLGRVLSSIDADALGRGAEKLGERLAQSMAQGKPPQEELLSPEMQELQSKIKNEIDGQMRTNGPALIRGIFSMVGPILRELKAEMGALAR